MDVLMIVLGWVLGLASALLLDEYRGWRKGAALKEALKTELENLRYKVACRVFSVRSVRATNASIDKDFLSWMRPIVQSYRGPDTNKWLRDVFEKLTKLGENQVQSPFLERKIQAKDKALKKFHIPLLSSQLTSLVVLSGKLQSQLLDIANRLESINQDVDRYWWCFEKTFDQPLTEENRKVIDWNISAIYDNVASQGTILVDRISAVLPRL